MKGKITLAIPVLALCAVLIFAGCKKNNPTVAVNVVGNWQFSNYSSQSMQYNPQNHDTSTGIRTYNAITKSMVTLVTHSSLQPHFDTINTSFVYSNWNIMSNGNYTISEDADAQITTTSGTWDYLSNISTNSAITFQNGGSLIFQFVQSSNAFTTLNIQSVTSHQMVLAFGSSYSDSTGYFYTYSGTVTLTK